MGAMVVLKFPKPQVAAVVIYHAAFVREAWVGTRVTRPLGGARDRAATGTADLFYTVMPMYVGELLETRPGRAPGVGLE